MGWERRGSERYYYRRLSVAGRQVRLYLGRGPLAELTAAAEEARRQAEALRRRQREQEAQRWGQADSALIALIRLTDLLLRAMLEAKGFHLHHRGQWRRARIKRGGSAMSTGDELQAGRPVDAEEVVQRARAGDRSVLPQLQALLQEHPELWAKYGDVAAQALAAWVVLASGDDLLLLESLRRRLDALQEELLAEGSSPLEQLLVGRLVTTHLQVEHADCLAAQARSAGIAAHRALVQRQESAQRRLLAAARALALCRRLLQPAARPCGPALAVHRAG
jgi:hypothetical protein